ncbi:hypothetical protein M0R72_15580 [Candidatus Pacearchaeota archaeon]|jgi:hypothetical protein|nr:hypothetical protein [Candidatus Pacearchaeota archaeon]
MADQTITVQTCTLNGQKEVAAANYEDLTAANDGICVIPRDGKYLFHIIDAAGGAVVTFTHGDGFLSGQGDIDTAALTINLNNFVVVESARCKWLSGDDKGMIRITTTAAVKIACIALP